MYRILVIENERAIREDIAQILKFEGFEVFDAENGITGVEKARLFRPDVVIADINLPGESGYAIARELRERHRTLAPLLIAISGKWTKASDRLLANVVGFDHYLLKPCDVNELLPLIEPLRLSPDKRAEL